MNVFNIAQTYPIGMKLCLVDDDPGTIHVIHGYEWTANQTSIIFKDGSKLNVERMDLISEVVA